MSHNSPSVVIQFYRLNSTEFWPDKIEKSVFLGRSADKDVKMCVFPIICSENAEKDIEEIRRKVVKLENDLELVDVKDDERSVVARYLRCSRGTWMQDNHAWGIYYYYRRNPSTEEKEEKPVSRGASLLVTGALPIETTLEFLVVAEEVIGNYQSQRYIHMLNQLDIQVSLCKEFNERAARAGLLVRSLSHHMGSHVLVNRKCDAEEKYQEAIDGTRNFESAAEYLRDDSKFYTYIRARMEFIAMLSLNAQMWSMPVTMEEIFEFLSNEESYILRDNIGANERIKIAECLMPESLKGQMVALPWGTTGCHAFYTLVEGILRNACKHGQINTNPTGDTVAHLKIEVEEEFGDFWLYCGVPEQTVSASDAAKAILNKIHPDAASITDPIDKLNEVFQLKPGDNDTRKRPSITTKDGEYAHSALGFMEMGILANFLSNDTAGLRVKDFKGNLFIGFKLTRPKGMHPAFLVSSSLPSDFRYDWESYVVVDDPTSSQWRLGSDVLPPLPLGPRTLYVTNTDVEPIQKYAHVKFADWDSCAMDQETVAKMILETGYKTTDFRVFIDHRFSAQSSPQNDVIVFFKGPGPKGPKDSECRKALMSMIDSTSRTLILAHGEGSCKIVEDFVADKNNVTVLPITGADQVTHLYVAQALRQNMTNSLRLLLYEAACQRYEIYDTRLYNKYSGPAHFESDKHVVIKQDKEIVNLAHICYSKDVIYIIHVSSWNTLQKQWKLDWKSFYPNIVFHTGRGGEARKHEEEYGFPIIDYSSLDSALAGASKTDTYIKLAFLCKRIGCTPRRR
jgi:hypothetical protein